MGIGGCPQICQYIWPRPLNTHRCLGNNLIFMLWHWTSPRVIGWQPHPAMQNCPGRPKNRAIWERYRSFTLPYGVLPLFCAVSRLVCEACVQADGISYPPGPATLRRVCQSHPVDVALRGPRPCCSFTHPSSERLISNMMHVLRI